MDTDAPVSPAVENWELELLKRAAAAFRTNDREELIAELGRQLLVLKSKPLPQVRNWEAYLAKFCYNKASNWVRNTRGRERRVASLDDPAAMHLGESSAEVLDRQIEARAMLARLNAKELRVVYAVAKAGDQSAAAKHVRHHRNTVRNWLNKARNKASNEKLRPAPRRPEISVAIPGPFVRFPNAVIDALLAERFTLVEMKILLWIVRHTIGWNRPSVRATWYGLAASLDLDRAGVFRAGKRLIARRMIHVSARKFGLQEDSAKWRLEKPSMSINVDPGQRQPMIPVNQSVGIGQRKRRRASTLFRRAKDSSKDRKTYKDSPGPETVDLRQRSNLAGAATPVQGKYDDVTT